MYGMTTPFRRITVWVAILTSTVGFRAAAQNWIRVSDIPSDGVNAIATDGATMYAATDSTVYVSPDGGGSWQPTPAQPAGVFFQTLHVAGGTVYAGTNGHGIYQSKDSGFSWTDVSNGLSDGGRHVIALARLGDSLYAGTGGDGVYVRSLAEGSSWGPYNEGLFQLGTNAILATDDLLVACVGMYVFARPRGGTQWDLAMNDSIQGPAPLSLARCDTSLFLGTSSGVFRGSLDGRTWQKADISQFPNQTIVALASVGSRLFAGLNYRSDHWLFSTENRGVTWDVRAHEFASLTTLLPVHSRMWAGRSDGLWWYDMGAWTSANPVEGQFPQRPVLHPNYPNPFNPSTTLSYELPKSSQVMLTVYDILGRKIQTIVNETQQPGRYEVKFDGSTLASGVYLYQLRAGSLVDTQKMLLTK